MELKTSLDWKDIEFDVRQVLWENNLKFELRRDIEIVLRNIGKMVARLGNEEAFNRMSERDIGRASFRRQDELVEQINAAIEELRRDIFTGILES